LSKSTFDFLQELNPELVQLGRSIDNIFYNDPHGVFVKGRLFAEKLLKDVVKKEKEYEDLLYINQAERIIRLEKEGILNSDITKEFDTVRFIGNKAAHEIAIGDIELAFKIHKSLFKIAVWYMEVYGDVDFNAPTYHHPIVGHNEYLNNEKISEMIQQSFNNQISILLKQELSKISATTTTQEETTIINHELSKTIELEQSDLKAKNKLDINFERKEIQGSSLLFELSKLKESSQEAVENSNNFSVFKKYLHVNRPIQNDLFNALKNSEKKSASQLILLCGSVGDGKSHLLAYMNQNEADLMSQYKIHNDATESFDPTKNSLDTLAEVLSPFSDTNVKISNEKLILAINLGVLHNFLESEYATESYNYLSSFINESNIFNTTVISENLSNENFHLISFSDYHPYEITMNSPKSDYFMKIFERITNNVDENPFYQAYLNDLSKDYKGPIISNYRLFSRTDVQEALAQLLIKAMIKYKVIVSTRALLNFIYDIIVPSNIDENLSFATLLEETEYLMPNILFGSPERSSLLKVMSKLDPIHYRFEIIDNIIIELNNSTQITDVYRKYLNLEGITEWADLLNDLGPFFEMSQSTRQILNTTLIRLAFFLAPDLANDFKDEAYEKYMSYLYAFNVGVPSGLRDIYREIEKAVYYWKGQPLKDSNYIYLDDTLSSMKISQELKLKPGIAHLKKRENLGVFSRFKNTIVLAYQDTNQENSVELEVDFPLYRKIEKVLNGYRPNKKDKEDAIQFTEFLDKLMKIGRKHEEILAHYIAEDLKFKLEYDSFFEQFTFKRE
jgi:DNA phosphorothioation-dependent restriction protein DptF